MNYEPRMLRGSTMTNKNQTTGNNFYHKLAMDWVVQLNLQGGNSPSPSRVIAMWQSFCLKNSCSDSTRAQRLLLEVIKVENAAINLIGTRGEKPDEIY